MASLQSLLFNIAIKYRRLFQVKLKREVWDQNTSIVAFREEAERINAHPANAMLKSVGFVRSLLMG